MDEDIDRMALDYHRHPRPGKLAIEPTKRMVNQRDLALAYSPGVAAACREIVRDPNEAAALTARANLVAVVTNGTAVLGLGPIGPLAAKPVMEGKAVLFKRFAGIDAFDIEIDERDPDRLVAIIASLEPSFGGINLEDIKAPECFSVEAKARARMNIPVMHDDQHGTAICVNAAVRNALELTGKRLDRVKIVCSGAGAAALACLDLLVASGASKANIAVCDIDGVVYQGRAAGMDPWKARYAAKTKARTLAEIVPGADIFLGLSAPRVLTGDLVAKMAKAPLIFALANPEPEIRPEEALAAKPDAIIATGRSDYPNQVNNVLVFPYVFRGALDVGARAINEEMKLAAADALARLARAEPSDVVARAYAGETLHFGPHYILPKPFDPRLITVVAPAVAQAAMASGVATRPIADLSDYAHRLSQFVYKSGQVMEPVFEAARAAPRRVVYAEGEDPRVLRAAQIALDDGLAEPILIGRAGVIERQIAALNLRLRPGAGMAIVDPQDNPRAAAHMARYLAAAGRRGVTPSVAETRIRTRASVLGALILASGEADAMLCGAVDPFAEHLRYIADIVPLAEGCAEPAAMHLLALKGRSLFIADTNVAVDPTAEDIARIARLAVAEVRRFGIEPRVGLVAHADFGASSQASARKMREAMAILRAEGVDFEVDGEMRADTAILGEGRTRDLPDCALTGPANLLVMPSLDAANIAANLAWSANEGMIVGPILMGFALPVHILANTVTVRGLVNMTALAVADAQSARLPISR
ncbi:MAG: NADP-dependent malic enzyme [Alphaproteobacteria bacterium]|nr:NADP-dependent malic enzyme [Alphaproteobacteria bacterium]